jgi:hypothetical protein
MGRFPHGLTKHQEASSATLRDNIEKPRPLSIINMGAMISFFVDKKM